MNLQCAIQKIGLVAKSVAIYGNLKSSQTSRCCNFICFLNRKYSLIQPKQPLRRRMHITESISTCIAYDFVLFNAIAHSCNGFATLPGYTPISKKHPNQQQHSDMGNALLP